MKGKSAYMDQRFWWDSGEESPQDLIYSLLENLKDRIETRADHDVLHLSLFENYYNNALNPAGYKTGTLFDDDRVTFNVIASCCNTVTAKIAKTRPRPIFLTSGGDFSLKRKAKLLTKFVDGMFYQVDLYNVMQRVFLDSCVFGTGVLKVFIEDDQIKVERVFPSEVIVDEYEARYGDPRSMFQRKVMPREVVAGLFPDHQEEVAAAAPCDPEDRSYNTGDMIEVIEAWHIPSVSGGDDGRHVICIDNATLFDEKYTKDYFPFVTLRWSRRMLGYYGQGLAEQLRGIQAEINQLLLNIQEQMNLATPKVFLERGSQVAKEQINNQTWGIIEYEGQPPRFFVPQTVAGEVFSHLDRLYNRAYEISGISQLSATSLKPAGLESGVALREYSDIETERFVIVGQGYEAAFLEIARQMIDLAKDASQEGKTYEVISYGDKEIEKIKWSDINLREDQYRMKVYPASLLPTTPAARLQTVIEMSQAGLLDKAETRSLLDFPDIEQYNKLATAPLDEAEMLVEEILEKGKYHPPEPFSNLQLHLQFFQRAYIEAKINGAPEDRLDLMRRYMQECFKLLQPPAPPVAAMPGGPTPEAGGPAPTELTPTATPPKEAIDELAEAELPAPQATGAALEGVPV